MPRDEKLTARSGEPSSPKLSEDFGSLVRDALAHLYDPVYLQTQPLARYLRSDSDTKRPVLGRALRQALLEAIEALQPGAEDTWGLARHSRLLQLRYVDGLDAKEVQAKLAIGRTHYYREQAAAVEAVASVLESRWGIGETEAGGAVPARGAEQQGLKPRHNLPVALTSFVGREREMAEVNRLLGETRLLTLTGTGGCGKTRLAYQVAEQLLRDRPEAFPEGIWAIELAALADPSLVVQTVASALGVREEPGVPILESLVNHLRPKRLLLVLDNCEHLLDASARLTNTLLLGCPALRVLATSREALGITGETSYRVPSLSLPDPHHLTSLADLAAYEAVRLFVERARAAQPSFHLTEQEAPSVCLLCWRLDGMPLAIELAAARVRGLGVEQLAARLDDRFRLLTGGSRTGLRRQQTLRATIDWSHDLLAEPERVLLRRLSVFAGGWTLEAAEAVCQGGEVDGDEVVDLLLRLVDRSLAVADTESQPTRYRLPETIRQYAQEKLLESGEGRLVSDRHLEWCLALTERAASMSRAGEWTRNWQERGEAEQDNLRTALDWSLARGTDADAALRLAEMLANFWYSRGRVAEMRERLGAVLARPGGEPAARIGALGVAAVAEAVGGDWRRGRELREEALALARETEDRWLIANALLGLSWVPSDLGDYVQARFLQEEALRVIKEAGDRSGIVEVLWHLTRTLCMIGDTAAARPLAEEGLSLSRDLSDPSVAARALLALAQVALGDDDLGRSRALAELALARATESADTTITSFCLGLLGDVARAEGSYASAEAYCRDSLKAFQQRTAGGVWLHTTGLLIRFAGAWAARGRLREAVLLYGAVNGWLQSMGYSVPHFPPRDYKRDEAAAREALGEEAFARAFAEGQAMTLEQAVEYALRGDEA